MLESIGVLILIVISVYLFLQVTWKIWTSKFTAVPCPFQVPWLGSAPYLEADSDKLFKQLQHYIEKFDGLYMLWFAWKPIYFTRRKEQVEALLRSQQMIRKSFNYDFLHDWLGTGLLTSWGAKWKSRRRAITPSFHFSILNDFFSVFVHHSDVLVEKVKKLAETRETVDAQALTSHATLDVICETAMGVKINAQSEDSQYVKVIHVLNSLLLYRIRAPWLWPNILFGLTTNGKLYRKNLNILHKFTTDIINKRIEARKNIDDDGKRKRAFLDMLLDLYDKGEIDVEGIREEVDTFMFEGHDTTGAALSWTLMELGNNPRVQKKLQQDIDEAETTEGTLMDKINATKYLEYVLKEGLRKHPPVAIFARTMEKDEQLGDINFTKGSTVVVNTYSLQRCEEYWSDPNEFKPERFAEDAFAKRNPYIYVPFSAGARNCIGQKFAMLEMKVILYKMMKYFTVKSLLKEEDIECSVDIIHKAVHDIPVQFSFRK